jgi:hypothetical protein
MRLFVRLSLVGLILLIAIGFWIQSTSTKEIAKLAPVTANGLCEGDGVSIVVDFGTDSELAPIQKCVTNYVGNSWNLMITSGIKVGGTSKYPVGFVCRINGIPTKETESCIETPGAANGSWAFYLVEANSWEYSSFGASSHASKCGTTEGWRFLLPGESTSTFPRIKPVKHSCEK